MLGYSRGLSAVATVDLKLLLRKVYREELNCPITQIGLAKAGILRLGDDLAHLRGLERVAVNAVLAAVLAERAAQN